MLTKKQKKLPPALQTKQWYRPLSSLMCIDGDLSSWKGHKTLYPLPDFLHSDQFLSMYSLIEVLFKMSSLSEYFSYDDI